MSLISHPAFDNSKIKRTILHILMISVISDQVTPSAFDLFMQTIIVSKMANKEYYCGELFSPKQNEEVIVSKESSKNGYLWHKQ